MMYDKRWQLSLCAILLVTFSACNHDAKSAEAVATEIQATPSIDMVRGDTNQGDIQS